MTRLLRLNIAKFDLSGIDIENAESADNVPVIGDNEFLLNVENIVDVKVLDVSKEIRASRGSHAQGNYQSSLWASAKVTTITVSADGVIGKYEVSQTLDQVQDFVNRFATERNR